MIDSRTLIPLSCLLATAALALGQEPPTPPMPPAPPTPAAAVAPAPPAAPPQLPGPARAPRAPVALEEPEYQYPNPMPAPTPRALPMERPFVYVEPPEPPMPRPAMNFNNDYAFNFSYTPPALFAPQQRRGNQNDDHLYDAGQRALDGSRWDEALLYFTQVASHGGARADAGLYWKAYALNRLGRRDDALAALAELRKSYASSRWLDDAKALELEVNQAAGRPVSPDSQSDDELKLLALNGLMQSDADRAIPLIENLLKGSHSPRLKSNALFVLAQSNSPRAQQILEQIARGGGNPDLQLKAINALTQQRRRQNTLNPNLLPEIYASTNDIAVKRAIINVYGSNRDKEHLTQVAKTEKLSELRVEAFQRLANNNPGQPELWQVYQSEPSPDMKTEILHCMWRDGNIDKLAEVARTEKDLKVRRVAIEVLASQQSPNTGDTLVSLYTSEQDPQLKGTIVDNLSNQKNAKYLVDLARAEKDAKLKYRIVERLANMKSKEAQDYMLEILK